ncbi:MAG TPA: transglycosylase domain-containing protein [Candidatus Limnocylindrales bacterium]|nr:transglycosylase domain-containing protein [Candidatus Limnocylindrales bacterium]
MGDRHERARRAAIRVLSVVRLSRRRRAESRTLLVVALSLLGTLSLGGGAEAFDRYQTYTRDLPDPQSLSTRELAQSTKIYDRNGTLLYVKHTAGVIRTVEPLAQISPHLVQATVAIEDRGFYTHHGVDFKRIVAAAFANITHQRIEQGASTITEQLVKTSFLSSQQTFERKIREAVLALEIERRFTKNDILTMYLNQIFYGHEAYGAETAAQTYFAKPAKALDIAESAMLAGIPNAPSAFDPLNPVTTQNAKDRQVLVLKAMLRDHYISSTEYAAAVKEPLHFQNGALQRDLKAPWFVDYVLQVLTDQYGADVVNGGGLQVTTTLDYGLQQITESAVRTEVNQPGLRARNVNNGAAEVIDPSTGQVLAMVGSADYYNAAIGGQFNVITGGLGRQPGSSFKIYDYATAFSNGYTPATLINDTQGKIDGHAFVDWDHRSEGLITLRQALAESRNIPAILLLKQLGYTRVFQTARLMGLTSADLRPDRGLAQAIGATEVLPLQHFNAYAVLASGGIYHAPAVILKVEDSQGRVLEQWKPSPGTRVLSPQVAYMISDILRPVGADLKIRRPFASKTGTTENWHDSWLIGYNPDIVIGAWMGHTCAGSCPSNVNTDLNVVWGVMGAGQIFRDVFNAYEANRPVHDFVVPDGLKKVTVCRASGLLATSACAGQTVTDWFVAGLAPARPDDWYQQIRVCTTDGGLATPDIPANLTAVRTFLVYPAGYPDDMKDHKAAQPPTQPCAVLTETVPPTLSLTPLRNADGTVSVTALAQDDEAVKEVDFFLDGATVPVRLTQGPFTLTVTGAPGSVHSLNVQAYDYNPANAPAAQTISVKIGVPSPQPSPSAP